MRQVIVCFFLLLFSSSIFALSVGEKLTVRVLKVSDTKKTLLLNRGIEDGVEENNQAMFYLTSGVVARGTVVKLTPTRSVWSLYRVSDSSQLRPDNVMDMKVISPADLTTDSTRDMVADNSTYSDKDLMDIPLADGAETRGRREMEEPTRDERYAYDDERDLRSLDEDRPTRSRTRPLKKKIANDLGGFELWSLLEIRALSSKATPNTGADISGNLSHMDLALGGEYYFKNKQKWFDKFSFSLFLRMTDDKTQSAKGNMAQAKSTEYGLGFSYHFINHPRSFLKPILFVNFNYGMGSATDTFESQAGAVTEVSGGKVTSYSLGTGFKYYFFHGLGLRTQLDYYSSTRKFDADDTGVLWDKTLSGFRFYMGLAYRF